MVKCLVRAHLCFIRVSKSLSFILHPEKELSDTEHQICNLCRSKMTLSKANMRKNNNTENQNTVEVTFIYISLFICMCIFLSTYSWFVADLAGNGYIRYVFFTIYINTYDKTAYFFDCVSCCFSLSIFILHSTKTQLSLAGVVYHCNLLCVCGRRNQYLT